MCILSLCCQHLTINGVMCYRWDMWYPHWFTLVSLCQREYSLDYRWAGVVVAQVSVTMEPTPLACHLYSLTCQVDCCSTGGLQKGPGGFEHLSNHRGGPIDIREVKLEKRPHNTKGYKRPLQTYKGDIRDSSGDLECPNSRFYCF